MRFLLGVAEAGFFPGVILYLPTGSRQHRARMVGIFMVAIPVADSSVRRCRPSWAERRLGLADGNGCSSSKRCRRAAGRRRLFWLTDKPAHATWLAAEQRDWLAERLDTPRCPPHLATRMSVWQTLFDGRVLLLALVNASATGASSGAGDLAADHRRSA